MYRAEKLVGLNQGAFYQELLTIYQALIAGEDNWLANMANLSAVLFDQMDEINWAGFYLWDGQNWCLDPFRAAGLCSHPQGQRSLRYRSGEAEPILVPDVHRFPGHIACDAASRSEVVIPFWHSERLIGVLDIDSPVLRGSINRMQRGCPGCWMR